MYVEQWLFSCSWNRKHHLPASQQRTEARIKSPISKLTMEFNIISTLDKELISPSSKNKLDKNSLFEKEGICCHGDWTHRWLYSPRLPEICHSWEWALRCAITSSIYNQVKTKWLVYACQQIKMKTQKNYPLCTQQQFWGVKKDVHRIQQRNNNMCVELLAWRDFHLSQFSEDRRP